MKMKITWMIVWMMLVVMPVSSLGEVVVLTDTPVAEFTLPDGSVLKNAFVWRRSSEGLMIIHDDGQYFLNFSLLPDEWKSVYLDGAQEEPEEPAVPEYEPYDPFNIAPVLETVKGLNPGASDFVLRKGADVESEKSVLALAVLHSLLSGNLDNAKRFILVIEEKGLDIESVQLDALFVECGSCDGKGRIEQDCTVCGGTGKCPRCDGSGERSTGIGSTTIHCTTCRGTGECVECKGAETKSAACRACRGRGKLLEKQYCEVTRDYYVDRINALANPDVQVSVTQADVDFFRRTLRGLPEIDPAAADYYVSDAYDGRMDTNILIACVMQSLLENRMEDAKRFYTMVEVYFPKEGLLEINAYLKPCRNCDGTGGVDRACRTCDGSGTCPRCDGDGKRDTGFKGGVIDCTTCKGTGKCSACDGKKEVVARCSVCGGSGRDFDKERSRIKLDILVEELNNYFAGTPEGALSLP